MISNLFGKIRHSRIGSARKRSYGSAAATLMFALMAPLGSLPAMQPGDYASDVAAIAAPEFGPAVVGTVTDSTGAPLGSVEVVVSGVNRSTTTDDAGKFIIRGLPPGSYHINLLRIGYSGQHVVVNVPASGPEIQVKVVMNRATIRLASVNVTATPTGTDPLNVTQATVQLAGKDLQRFVAASIGQTLSSEPGMATRFNGPVANAPVIRGLTGERVLVLQDGDRAGDLSSAAADHLNAVDPSAAERLEVIRGPASLLYGNNALGGVVNVITNDIPNTLPARVTGFLSGQGESGTSGAVGNFGLTLPLAGGAVASARGGYRTFNEMKVGGGATQANTNGHTANATVGASFIRDNSSFGLGFRDMEFEYGLPFAPGNEQIRIDGSRRQAVLKSTLNTKSTLVSTIRVDGTAQWYKHAEIEPSGESGTQFALNTQTLNVTARTKTGRVTGALGVQGFLRQYSPVGDEAFTPAANNTNVAMFVYEEIPLTRADNAEHAAQLQVGARVDHFSVETRPNDALELERFGLSENRSFNNVSGSFGVSIPLTAGASLAGNVSRGFRAPTVEELFAYGYHAAAGTFDVGNAELKSEQSTGFEVGLRAQGSRVFGQVNTYYNMISNYVLPRTVSVIDLDGEDTNTPLVNFSQGNARMYGFEAQVEAEVVKHLIGGLMGDFTRATLKEGGNLPFIPAGRIGGSLRFDNGRLSWGGDVRRVFRQDKVSGDVLDVPTAEFTLVNVSASWIFSPKSRTVNSLTLRADNLFDAEYRDATSRIKSFALNAGRNVSVVYKILF